MLTHRMMWLYRCCKSVTLVEHPFQLREKRCAKDREVTPQGSLYGTKTDCSRVSERLHGQKERCVISVVKRRITFAYPVKMIQLHESILFSREKDSSSFLAERALCDYDLPLHSRKKILCQHEMKELRSSWQKPVTCSVRLARLTRGRCLTVCESSSNESHRSDLRRVFTIESYQAG